MKSMRRKKTNMIRLMRIPLVECRLIGLQIAALAALYVLGAAGHSAYLSVSRLCTKGDAAVSGCADCV